jgi:hypothetical protein
MARTAKGAGFFFRVAFESAAHKSQFIGWTKVQYQRHAQHIALPRPHRVKTGDLLSDPRQIARMLQDDVLQSLALVRLLVDEEAGSRNGQISAQITAQISTQVQSAIRGVREVISALWPLVQDDMGLEAALRQVTLESVAEGGPEVEWLVRAGDPPTQHDPAAAGALCLWLRGVLGPLRREDGPLSAVLDLGTAGRAEVALYNRSAIAVHDPACLEPLYRASVPWGPGATGAAVNRSPCAEGPLR